MLHPQRSEIWATPSATPRSRKTDPNTGKDTLEIIVTSLYCKLLVILGIAFPMAETITEFVPKGFYQFFYVYLFLGSLLFLLFVYVDLCQQRAPQVLEDGENILNMLKTTFGMASSAVASTPVQKSGKSNEVLRPKNVYGSFYLRLGALLFGVGAMIYSAIEIGLFLETSIGQTEPLCQNFSATLRPLLQTIFVFVQMYFIFLNLKMNVYQHKFVSRLGLMHMIATNLCVWLSVLIMETSHEIESNSGQEHIYHSDVETIDTIEEVKEVFNSTDEPLPVQNHLVKHVLHKCKQEHNIMGSILFRSAPFLFPCTIEYSLICAAVLYMMWKHVDEEHEWAHRFKRRHLLTRQLFKGLNHQEREHHQTSDDQTLSRISNIDDNQRRSHANESNVENLGEVGKIDEMDQVYSRHHLYSVDCSRANNGLFCGIFVTVVTVITIIVFFVLIGSQNPMQRSIAITLGSVTELSLYSLSTSAVVIGIIQIRQLKYDPNRKIELDTLLLIVAQTGVFLYATFSIIGTFFQLQNHLLSFLGSLATIIQTTLQTVFILDASSRHASTLREVHRKPGREIVTFLLVCNLAMWAIRSLETNRADSHPIQAEFYGGGYVWPIITHVSMPLAIFYRFHSTVCLCGIWTKTFKFKDAEYMFS